MVFEYHDCRLAFAEKERPEASLRVELEHSPSVHLATCSGLRRPKPNPSSTQYFNMILDSWSRQNKLISNHSSQVFYVTGDEKKKRQCHRPQSSKANVKHHGDRCHIVRHRKALPDAPCRIPLPDNAVYIVMRAYWVS